MWATRLICLPHVIAVATAQVTPSADCILVMRKMWWGFGTTLSKRKSVQPSTKIVSSFSSSATGPRAGVLPLEMTPVKRSIFSDSLSRRISFTLASVPAFSSALSVSIFRLPSRPPWALISSAASVCPLKEGSPSTAAAPVKKVMWAILYGVSGMLPLGCACAVETSGTAASGTPAAAAAPAAAVPTVTPKRARKSRRLTSCVMCLPSSLGDGGTPVWNRADHARQYCPSNRGNRKKFPAGGGASIMGPVVMHGVKRVLVGLGQALRARWGIFAAVGPAVVILDV